MLDHMRINSVRFWRHPFRSNILTDEMIEVTIRMPTELHKRLENYTETRRATTDEMIVRLLDRYLGFIERKKGDLNVW